VKSSIFKSYYLLEIANHIQVLYYSKVHLNEILTDNHQLVWHLRYVGWCVKHCREQILVIADNYLIILILDQLTRNSNNKQV